MTKKLPVCEKCGKPVALKDNRAAMDYFLRRARGELRPRDITLSEYVGQHTPWHILANVKNDGTVVCEGSPSRAQYVEGQPVDTRRNGFRYDSDRAPSFRDAYKALQEV